MIDLAGRTMIPGFIDAHGHMWGAGVQAMAANLLPPPDGPVRSIADLQAQLRQWMATSTIARDFGVVIGFGYDDSQLAEQRHPTAEELDEVSTRPADDRHPPVRAICTRSTPRHCRWRGSRRRPRTPRAGSSGASPARGSPAG